MKMPAFLCPTANIVIALPGTAVVIVSCYYMCIAALLLLL
jgi:hypothetical protein